MNSPAYLYGQILVLRGLWLRLATETLPNSEVRQIAHEVIDSLRIAGEPRAIPDELLSALDDFENWIDSTT